MASYKIEIKKSALKDLQKLEKNILRRILKKIELLSNNPHVAQAQKLKNTDNSYRFRVGDYRVVFQIDTSNKIVFIFGIGHRKEIYRDI